MKIKIGKKNKNNNAEMRTETISDKSKFAIVESYKSARSNIMFSLSADDDKLFAVTSYSKGEGKSTVSANLAISFSKMEKKVLLVDCDLRRPNIHNIFKIENQAGLSNVIGKMVEFEEVIHRNVLPNLDILPSGTIPPNPSELLCSPKFTNLIKKLYEEYDYIIFDTPPVGVVIDSLPLVKQSDGVVLVVKHNSTTYPDLKKIIETINRNNGKILGVIVNNVESVKSHKYGKGYGYGYGYGY